MRTRKECIQLQLLGGLNRCLGPLCLVQMLACCLLPVHFAYYSVLGAVAGGARTGVPACHPGSPDGVAGSCLWPDQLCCV